MLMKNKIFNKFIYRLNKCCPIQKTVIYCVQTTEKSKQIHTQFCYSATRNVAFNFTDIYSHNKLCK